MGPDPVYLDPVVFDNRDPDASPDETEAASVLPLVVLRDAFETLTQPPRPLAIDGSEVPGLADRMVPIGELRSRLLHPSTPFVTRDMAAAFVLRRAQHEGGAWVIAMAGLLLPALVRIAADLTRHCPDKRPDLEAEMLTSLVAAIATTDPNRARLASRLTWAAKRAALAAMHAERSERARPTLRPVPAAPPRPWRHPELVLVQAVEEGVLGASDAELIAATRLGDMTLHQAATEWGVGYDAIKRRRSRAERALVAWIRDGFVPDRPETGGSKGAGGRPRHGHQSGREPELRPDPVPDHATPGR